MSAAFDTLSVAHDLEAAGFDRPQAEAVAKAINHGDAQASTKADLDQLRRDIEAGEARLEARIYRALWMQGGALAAIILAAKLF